MVPWLKTGLDYQSANSLETCLLCGNPFSDARKQMGVRLSNVSPSLPLACGMHGLQSDLVDC